MNTTPPPYTPHAGPYPEIASAPPMEIQVPINVSLQVKAAKSIIVVEVLFLLSHCINTRKYHC